MDITYLGHSSFKLKGKNVTVVCDPFFPDKVGLKYPKVDADIVTVSHSHPDHNNVSAVEGPKTVIDEPGEYEIKGVSIVGVGLYHDNKKGEERGETTAFVIEIDGVRVVHLGDLGHTLTDKQVDTIGSVDVLLIPVGGFYTIGPDTATEVVRLLEPYIVVPMHYKVDGLASDISVNLRPVEDFLKEIGLPVERMQKLSLRKELFTEEQKVVVLDTK